MYWLQTLGAGLVPVSPAWRGRGGAMTGCWAGLGGPGQRSTLTTAAQRPALAAPAQPVLNKISAQTPATDKYVELYNFDINVH